MPLFTRGVVFGGGITPALTAPGVTPDLNAPPENPYAQPYFIHRKTALYVSTLKASVYFKLIHTWHFNAHIYLENQYLFTAPGKFLTTPMRKWWGSMEFIWEVKKSFCPR